MSEVHTIDMFPSDPSAAPGSGPIKNARQEAFCVLFSSTDADGKAVSATAAYSQAFGQPDLNAAAAAASRLLTNPTVRARVAHLRSKIAERLGIDRAAILIRRWEIAQKGGQSPAARANQLAALRDVEKSLGFVAPENPQQNNFFGDVHNGDNTQFNGIFKITDPAAFARAAELHRAALERSASKPV